ncbi:GbsR/MarR family transcriptional regulator [Flexithrix dorotheae]|uniref:GbsR/MarR family transcriptional regulator n=1 Tax=Flexithrix dorotheae TaxID=70993 RepID=UPI000374B818|nr:hypothetical protein [Flexithrix dorotheae]
MNEIHLSNNQKELIEKFGVFLESKGWQPAIARVLGLLMISDTNELTFDQIREVLHLSKSATSSALNFLLNTNKIEYITKTGERKRYFRIRQIMFEDILKEEQDMRHKFISVLKEVHELKESKNLNGLCETIKDVIDYLEFTNNHLPKLYAEWVSNRRK